MGMRSASYPPFKKYALVDSPVRTSPRARTQRFSSFPTAPIFDLACKIDPEAKLIPKIKQTGPLILCCKRLMCCYCSGYCTDQITLKDFTAFLYVIDFVSVTDFNIGTCTTPDNDLTPSW